MSHYTTIETKLTDGEVLAQAMEEMGYTVEHEKNLRLSDWRGRTTLRTADMVIKSRNNSNLFADIGFKKVKGHYKVIMDNIDSRRGSSGDFIKELTQKYSYLKVKKEVARQGLKIVEERIHKDKTIELVAVSVS